MVSTQLRPGGWVDIDQDVLAVFVDNAIRVERGNQVTTVAIPPGEAPILYLRCAVWQDVVGLVCQGQSGIAWLSIRGGPLTPLGSCGGQNAVEIYSTPAGFTVVRQVAAKAAVRTTLDLTTGQMHDDTFAIQETSQGFWDKEALTDNIRGSVPGMLLPSRSGDLIVGQDPVRDATRYRYKDQEGILFIGASYEPRVTTFKDGWRVVTRSKHGYIDAIVTLPITSFPVADDPGVVVGPPPVPPVEEPTMSLLTTIQAVRMKYDKLMTDDQCAELCNEVAWIHRNDPEQWGVSLKESGTRGRRYDGTEIAHDVVLSGKTGEGFDILTAAGAASTPTWSSVGVITNPARRWVAPIQPQGTLPVPPPTPVPTPTPTPQVCTFVPGPDYSGQLEALRVQQVQLDARLQGISEQLAQASARQETLAAELLKAITAVGQQVATLPPPQKCRLRF